MENAGNQIAIFVTTYGIKITGAVIILILGRIAAGIGRSPAHDIGPFARARTGHGIEGHRIDGKRTGIAIVLGGRRREDQFFLASDSIIGGAGNRRRQSILNGYRLVTGIGVTAGVSRFIADYQSVSPVTIAGRRIAADLSDSRIRITVISSRRGAEFTNSVTLESGVIRAGDHRRRSIDDGNRLITGISITASINRLITNYQSISPTAITGGRVAADLIDGFHTAVVGCSRSPEVTHSIALEGMVRRT